MGRSLSEEGTLSESLIKHENGNSSEDSATLSNKQCIGTMECGDGCGFSGSTEDSKARLMSIRKLGIATVLCLVFISVEVTGGIFANSLAILTDAAHLLSDVAGFAISLFAIWASGWEATPRQTYGFFRLEILGALVSIQLIWLLTGILVYEAIDRIIHTTEAIDGRLMFIVACFGLCVNIVMLLLLGHDHNHSHSHSHSHSHTHSHGETHSHEHHEDGIGHNDHNHTHEHSHDHHDDGRKEEGSCEDSSSIHIVSTRDVEDGKQIPCKEGSDPDSSNINVRGAYLHVLGDLVQSIGVMIGGAVIWVKPSWKVVDLICTLFFSVIVLSTTIKLLRDIVEILMESTPREIDHAKLEEGLQKIPGVMAIHELHIWAITMGKPSLACHATIEPDANADAVLKEVLDFCKSKFNISHVTVQIERAHSYSTS